MLRKAAYAASSLLLLVILVLAINRWTEVDVPPVKQIVAARYLDAQLDEDDPIQIPSFELVHEEIISMHSILMERTMEPNPMKWQKYGALQFDTRSGSSMGLGIYVTDWPPTASTRVVYRPSKSGARGSYYDCGTFLEFRASLHQAQIRSSRPSEID